MVSIYDFAAFNLSALSFDANSLNYLLYNLTGSNYDANDNNVHSYSNFSNESNSNFNDNVSYNFDFLNANNDWSSGAYVTSAPDDRAAPSNELIGSHACHCPAKAIGFDGACRYFFDDHKSAIKDDRTFHF